MPESVQKGNSEIRIILRGFAVTAVTRTLLFPEILQLLIVTGREAAETEAGAKPVPIKTVQSRRIISCFNSLCIYTKPDRSVVSVI